ncbi:MAG: hypothetical protein ACW986_15105 [Promethearchaeota archaeon]|jgi:hypothetical protein
MEVQIGKMILWGVISAILYIAVPFLLFYLLDIWGLMSFTQAFKTSIIIIGIIGVVFSMLSHLFPKDTSANRLVAFGSTVYSGIYLFYIFGGFTPGASYGSYSIAIPPIEVFLGLQLIAWLMLGSSAIRAMRYLIEAIELRKKTEYNLRKFKLSTVFKVLGTIASLIMFGYLGTIIYSGLNLGFSNLAVSDVGHDPGPTPLDPSDDTINMTISFDISNQGIYAIYDLTIDVFFSTVTSANASTLPENTVIGQSISSNIGTIHSFSAALNNEVTVVIDPLYTVGFLTTDCVLEVKISFSTLYAKILVNLNISIQTPWTALI